jgi:hypothetical protein
VRVMTISWGVNDWDKSTTLAKRLAPFGSGIGSETR